MKAFVYKIVCNEKHFISFFISENNETFGEKIEKLKQKFLENNKKDKAIFNFLKMYGIDSCHFELLEEVNDMPEFFIKNIRDKYRQKNRINSFETEKKKMILVFKISHNNDNSCCYDIFPAFHIASAKHQKKLLKLYETCNSNFGDNESLRKRCERIFKFFDDHNPSECKYQFIEKIAIQEENENTTLESQLDRVRELYYNLHTRVIYYNGYLSKALEYKNEIKDNFKAIMMVKQALNQIEFDPKLQFIIGLCNGNAKTVSDDDDDFSRYVADEFRYSWWCVLESMLNIIFTLQEKNMTNDLYYKRAHQVIFMIYQRVSDFSIENKNKNIMNMITELHDSKYPPHLATPTYYKIFDKIAERFPEEAMFAIQFNS